MSNVPNGFVALDFQRRRPDEMCRLGQQLAADMERRRSVRAFSSEVPPAECIETAIRIALRAPSGANRQPWRFVIVDDPAIKREIRLGAEREERDNYDHRFKNEMRAAVAPLGTTWEKPFLEEAPYLVVVFKEPYVVGTDGRSVPNYYVNESVGIACGFFIMALHLMGVATLTHTPSPMGFLNTILDRPANEKPYIVFPIGYPAEGATVPDLVRKPYDEVVQWNR